MFAKLKKELDSIDESKLPVLDFIDYILSIWGLIKTILEIIKVFLSKTEKKKVNAILASGNEKHREYLTNKNS